MADGEPLVLVNRPQRNKNVVFWLRCACAAATKMAALVIVSCDTAEQAAHAARKVTRFLPRYSRIALERMYDPATRSQNRLS